MEISDIYDYINDSPKKLFPEKIEQHSVLQMAKSLDGTWESVRDNKHSTPNVFLINNMHVELKFESADNPVIANYHIFYKQGALFIDYPGNTKTEDQHFDNELLDYTGGNDDSFFYYTYYVDDDKNIHDMSLIYNRVE